MTYSLQTLTTSGTDAPGITRPAAARFAHETVLLLGGAGIAFWLLALLTYSPFDPAFSTSGAHGPLANWGGRLGAYLADASYYVFGLSAWWLASWRSTILSCSPRPVPRRRWRRATR